MTIKYLITKLYNRKKLIPVCSISWGEFQRGERETIDIKVQGEWIKYKPTPNQMDYRQYTHGLKYENAAKFYGEDAKCLRKL